MDRTVLKGYRSTRKTELISLIYLIIYIFKGKLPWSNIKDDNQINEVNGIKNKQKKTKIKDLFEGIPAEFYMVYTEIQRLNYNEIPKYEEYKEIINNLLISKGGNINEKFCWEPKIEELKKKLRNEIIDDEYKKKYFKLFKGYLFKDK